MFLKKTNTSYFSILNISVISVAFIILLLIILKILIFDSYDQIKMQHLRLRHTRVNIGQQPPCNYKKIGGCISFISGL